MDNFQVRSVAVRLSLDNARYIASSKQAATVTEQSARGIEGSFGRASRNSVAALRKIQVGLVGLGLGKIITDSVRLEATYSSTMNTIQAQTGASAAKIYELDQLALQLGKDSMFSATQAADAMLELAKGGFTPAQIAGGAVQATMRLAATEGMNLADAAIVIANNMNAFNLEAKQAGEIADILAAGSAASTASVESLAEGLSNVGGVARGFGLDLNETVGVLAAFDQNALRGAEGGTAFRSMLTELAAPTEKSKKLMDRLGISLYDSDGRFRDITDIAEQFRVKLSGLSQAERARVATVIAGSYGQRGLNVLVQEGAAGLSKYIEATEEQGKAQELADARMKGTKGSLELLKGEVEDAQLALGRGLAPTIQHLAGELEDFLAEQDFKKWGQNLGSGIESALETAQPFAEAVLPLLNTGLQTLGDVLETVGPLAKDLAGAFGALPDDVQKAALLAGGTALLARRLRGNSGGGGLLGGAAASLANPVPVFVVNQAGGVPLGRTPTPVGTPPRPNPRFGAAGLLPKLLKGGAAATLIGLITSGKAEEWGFGDTANFAGMGGLIGGVPGALWGGSIGALSDTYHAGDKTLSVIDRAKAAVESGDIYAIEKALADVNTEAERLANGGWGTNIARGVVELTGRRGELEQVAGELKSIIDMAGNDRLDVLLGVRPPTPAFPGKGPLKPTPGFLQGVQGWETVGPKPAPPDWSWLKSPFADDDPAAGNWDLAERLARQLMGKKIIEAIFGKGAFEDEAKPDSLPGIADFTASITMDARDVEQKSPNLERVLDDLTQERTIRIRLALIGTTAASGAVAGAVTPSEGSGGSNERVADALSRSFRGYGDGTTSYGAGGSSSSAAQAGIDYDRLASAVGRAQQPLIGHMVMQPHNYSEFQRQIDQVRTSRAAAGE